MLCLFSQDNRWKKKALSVVPMKFGLSYVFGNFSVSVNILGDGTVSVNSGGVEVGQGLNTKVSHSVYSIYITQSCILCILYILPSLAFCVFHDKPNNINSA